MTRARSSIKIARYKKKFWEDGFAGIESRVLVARPRIPWVSSAIRRVFKFVLYGKTRGIKDKPRDARVRVINI